jgi:fermentation-respiration switch protein FrsA (DUF1100 family)
MENKARIMSFLLTIAKILGVVIVIYAVYAGYYFFNQRSILFPTGMIPIPNVDTSQFPDLEKIWLDTSVGKVEAWFLPPLERDGSKPYPVMIVGHGNGELIDYWVYGVEGLRRLGIGVLLVEYPGYGRSEGEPTKKTITETFITAYDTLAARQDVDESRIVLFGLSLGGGAVCELAKARPSKALILMSTFTSVKEFAAQLSLPPVFIRDPFDNLAVVQSYPNEVLVIHGKWDELIPYEMGVKLFQAARQGTMISYECGHNDCIYDWDVFWRDVEPFLREAGVVERD